MNVKVLPLHAKIVEMCRRPVRPFHSGTLATTKGKNETKTSKRKCKQHKEAQKRRANKDSDNSPLHSTRESFSVGVASLFGQQIKYKSILPTTNYISPVAFVDPPIEITLSPTCQPVSARLCNHIVGKEARNCQPPTSGYSTSPAATFQREHVRITLSQANDDMST